MRAVVVGASSGLGRCIGVGLAARGAGVALLARRVARLESAVDDAGTGAHAIACDVTDPTSVEAAIAGAARALGGIDALVYTPGISPLSSLRETDAVTWRRVLDTNVTGAAIVTTAALPHLQATGGRALYFSSISAAGTPWPGLGAYVVSKAALEKLVEAWRAEHPEVGFTRVSVGDCPGGPGDGITGFVDDWDPDLAGQMITTWVERGLVSGSLIDVDHLVEAVHGLLVAGRSLSIGSIVLTPQVRRS